MGKQGKEGPGESRVKGGFGLRGSLGVCRESESPSAGHVGWREGTEENTHAVRGGVASCLAFHFEAFY